jgi:putative transposase
VKNRDYKNLTQGNYYHIYNRGNNKQEVFRENADYSLFLSRLKENLFPPAQSRKIAPSKGRHIYVRKTLPVDAFSLINYCLMPNHFHFLIRQNSDLPINVLISKLCTSYSMCFNLKYEQTGGLFQSKFRAILVKNNEYLLLLSAYIHGNPFVADIVECPADWPWSSYLECMEVLKSKKVFKTKMIFGLCETTIITDQFKSATDYENFVIENVELMRERKEMENLLLD